MGAVIVIALFYTAEFSWLDLAGAFAVVGILMGLNRLRVWQLTPYLLRSPALGAGLPIGHHATLAGVLLAFAIPMERTPCRPDGGATSPLHRLEHALHLPVAFLIVPIFGLANAGVPVLSLPAQALVAPATLGVGLGCCSVKRSACSALL